ncbi:hypothetical protein BJ875DRAFT_449962 [Amylocarpus encephaloides]|uniref:ABM domain-containing protein n=1 Tax=Amylocarpus encephaloides TaxID=45428 RepID=A0A9P8C9G3_9HELO|nr:hypothetical protein BJ875DRAFT_449962 [Amylocarpus encephaloides]
MSPPPVTEAATLTLKPGVNVDGDTEESHAWAGILKTICEQEGFISLTCGAKVEDERSLVLMVDWTSHQSHLDFIARPLYQPFMKRVAPLIDNLTMHHYHPSSPSLLASSPVVEIAILFNTTPTYYSTNLTSFRDALRDSKSEGLTGVEIAEVLEELAKEEGGDKGRTAMLFVGWESVDAHMRFRESETFKNNIATLRDGVGAIEMVGLLAI